MAIPCTACAVDLDFDLFNKECHGPRAREVADDGRSQSKAVEGGETRGEPAKIDEEGGPG